MKTKIICDPPAPNKGIDPKMYAKTIEHLLWKENERRCREHALIDSTKDFHYEEYSNKGPKNDLELVSNWKHEGAWVFHVWHSQSSFHDIAEWCLERGIPEARFSFLPFLPSFLINHKSRLRRPLKNCPVRL